MTDITLGQFTTNLKRDIFIARVAQTHNKKMLNGNFLLVGFIASYDKHPDSFREFFVSKVVRKLPLF